MQETVPTPPAAAGPLERCAEPGCRKSFRPRRPWQKYHTSSCRKRHWRRRREPSPASHLSCPHCGTPLSLALQPASQLPVIPLAPSEAEGSPWFPWGRGTCFFPLSSDKQIPRPEYLPG